MPHVPVGSVLLWRPAALLSVVALLTACGGRPTAPEPDWSANVTAFERDLQDLQAALAIPGLAFAIVDHGGVVASRAFGVEQGENPPPFTTATPLRIASITKSMTAVAALQLVEEGRLDLDAPARHYAPDLDVPDEVRVRHLLTHTSEGLVGREYVYGTTRFASLGPVLEAVTGQRFEALIRERVLDRAGMRVHPSPFLGPHGGLISTVEDVAAYLAALDRGRLLRPASLDRLAVPSRATTGEPLPVSLGWFTQEVQGHRVMWSYGQDDPDHSGALLLRVPERGVSLFVLANANVLSDPFRLLMGDVSKSPVAMSFLRLFVFSDAGAPLPRLESGPEGLDPALARVESATTYRFRDELIGWALVDLWTNRGDEAEQTLDLVTARYGAVVDDPVLHFAALSLPSLSAKDRAISTGERLLARHPGNRWMLLAQGYLLQQRGQVDEASAIFERIPGLPNQEPDHLGYLFRAWSWMALAQMTAEHDPARARDYLRQIVALGLGGDVQDAAEQMLRALVP